MQRDCRFRFTLLALLTLTGFAALADDPQPTRLAPLSSIKLDPKAVGEDYEPDGVLVIDDFARIEELPQAKRAVAEKLKQEFDPIGVVGTAEYSLVRTKKFPLNTVVVRVYVFETPEKRQAWCEKKYAYEGWEKHYRKVDSDQPGRSILDSTELNKRIVHFDRLWITTHQLHKGDDHIKAAEGVIKQLMPEVRKDEKDQDNLPTYTQEELDRLAKFREGNGIIVMPGVGFPNRWTYRPKERRHILWYSLQYIDDYASGVLPEIRPRMLRPLAKEPLITGLKLDSLIGIPCHNCPERLEFGDSVLRDLPVADYLECLYLHRVDLTSAKRLRYLRDMERLEWLEIKNCGAGLQEIMQNVGPLPALEELRISSGGAIMMGREAQKNTDAISPEDVKAFAKRVPKLKILAIEDSIDTPLTPEVLLAFSNFTELRELSISGVSGRDYRKVTEAHNAYYKSVVDPLKRALPHLTVRMSSRALDLSGTGFPSLQRDE